MASSSRLPSYSSGPLDELSRVSLSALDLSHPAHEVISTLDLSTDSAHLWSNSQSGINVCPQAMSTDDASLEVSPTRMAQSTCRRTRRRASACVVSSPCLPAASSRPSSVLQGWGREAGYFLVISTTRRKISRITVQLVSRQSLAFPKDKGRREDDVVFRREVTLDRDPEQDGGDGMWLEKGLNT